MCDPPTFIKSGDRWSGLQSRAQDPILGSMLAASHGRITAVLGPTNTGKTYLAVERMLGHRSGMIGFPLRLLARENYDRIVRLRGARSVALVTGEEKIVPPRPAYFVCTVESMPLDRKVAFLAVDEIQLAADPDRGHVFTHRLQHARGEEETMFLGAQTVRPLLRKLVPGLDHLSRPRFSRLAYAGARKLTRLPPRSAVVAFSAAEVYGIAELIRRQRGGTAVVMGALSPRTRNAQVAMYQAGEVDYLVATDAIGMGLNMDLDHVAFAALSKFDGRAPRRLGAAELAQIAGRAGRHMNDGTFGTTAEVGPLEPEVVQAIEDHRFEALSALFWRNSDLDFRSPALLLKSLEEPPPLRGLARTREAEDHMALAALMRDPGIARLATGPASVRLLWEVCQIPDYRKILSDAHARLLSRVYRYLAEGAGGGGRLPVDWVAAQIARIERTDGDLDTLMGRISHIRTWTYISHRADWLDDPGHWQGRAREIEDRLSDALHQLLTQRFVDRRQAVLVRRMKGGGRLLSAVTAGGEVIVEGHPVGRLDGFRFLLDGPAHAEEARSLMTSARRALAQELPSRLRRFETDPDTAFSLSDDGAIAWEGATVARLAAGEDVLRPRVEPLAGDLLDGAARERLRRRLVPWLERLLRRDLGPLWRAREARLEGAARGISYQLVEAFGLLPRRLLAPQLAALAAADRNALARVGVRLGLESVWVAGLAGGPGARRAALLWALHQRRAVPGVPPDRPLQLPRDAALPEGFYLAIGYRTMGGVAYRADALERLARAASHLARQGPFAETASLRALVGCAAGDLPPVLAGLGYTSRSDDGVVTFVRRGRGERRKRRGNTLRPSDRGRSPGAASPFARLAHLRFRR